jgi:hypothetical protein
LPQITTPADGDEQLVGGELPPVLDRGDDRPSRAVAPGRGQLGPDDHTDVLGLERGPDLLAGEGLLVGKQPVQRLDNGYLLASEPLERLGHLYADRAAAEHQQPARQLPGGGGAAVVPGRAGAKPRDRRDHRARANCQHHRLVGGEPAGRPVGSLHLDGALAGQPAAAPHQLDALARQPGKGSVVAPARGHVIPLGEGGGHVQAAGDRLGRARHPLRRGQHVARAEQRLGGNAAPIGALPTDQLTLDHGHAQPTVGATPGGVLPRRTGADHDHVELAIHALSSPRSVVRLRRG